MLKIFGTDGIRCRVNEEPMTAETCLKIAKTAGYILSKKSSKKNRVLISKDTRLSGYLFEPLMTSGFVSMGMDVILVGPLPTPALPMLIKSLRADMGVMITASHNTYEYNGLKFFDSDGFKISRDLEKNIEAIVSNNTKYKKIFYRNSELGKVLRLEDVQGRYSEFLKSTINKNSNFKKIKIALDCGNGATYNVAPSLFWELGCDVYSINDRPNGRNINENCGAVNIKQLSKKVIEVKADIGFAFDGDGDRIIVVDQKGKKIDGDQIIALFAKNLLKLNKIKKKIVVTTVMSNLGLEKYLNKELKIKLIRTKVGDINVITEMKKKSLLLGGEQSGHIILGEYSKTGDGILCALKILEIMSLSKMKSSDLFDLYEKIPQLLINIKIKSNFKKENILKMNKITKIYQKNNPSLRFLVRKSGTEPLIRILIEGLNRINIEKVSNNISADIKKIFNVK
jgi:phosphoglucosamine mutase|tara:strand:+ start:396 stop:1757 length:1362 start_codon:yes stop_codon:yes gene_type:complete